MFFTFRFCFYLIRYMLQSFRRFGIYGKLNRDTLLAIAFISMEDDNPPLLTFTYVHNAEVETIGGKAQVVADTYRELAHKGFFGSHTVTNHR